MLSGPISYRTACLGGWGAFAVPHNCAVPACHAHIGTLTCRQQHLLCTAWASWLFPGGSRPWLEGRQAQQAGKEEDRTPKVPTGRCVQWEPGKGSLQDAWRPFSVGAGGLVCACSCSGRTLARCAALLLPQRCVVLCPRRAPGCAALPAGQPVAHGQVSALRCPHRTQLRTCMKGG